MSREPRLGDSPPPGHWASRLPCFAGSWYLARGFDHLADNAGMADGLSLLLREHGLTIETVQSAGETSVREWFYACYARYSGKSRSPALWDVAALSSGIYSPDSGWTLPPHPG
jgi:hypothetical protein